MRDCRVSELTMFDFNVVRDLSRKCFEEIDPQKLDDLLSQVREILREELRRNPEPPPPQPKRLRGHQGLDKIYC